MPVGSRLGKLDKISLLPVFRRRNALNELIINTSEIAAAIGEHVELLVPTMLGPYADKLGVAIDVLEQSLFGLLNHKNDGYPTLRDCRKANWILASNVGTMREGHPLEPFAKVYKREWTPMVMVDGYEDCTQFGVNGCTYVFMALAGYAATEEFRKFVPKKGGRWFVHTEMFKLPGIKYRFYQPKEQRQPIEAPLVYMDMYTWVLLDPNCKYNEVFERAECSTTFQAHNRALFKGRHEDCPYGCCNSCIECLLGLSDCKFATHREPYVSNPCPACGELGMFKEDDPEKMCISCRRDHFLQRKRWATRHRKATDGNEHEAEGGELLVQPGEGSTECVAGDTDESCGICSGPEVEHQPVAGDTGA